MSKIDLAKFQADVLNDPIVNDIWRSKYRYNNEASVTETRKRVVKAICADESEAFQKETLEVMLAGHFCPAGRILAGAGTGRSVTLLNCFTSETVQDCLPGIQRVITRASLTMQQGGGIGTDYSTIRPAGAVVKRTGSVSSGIIPFADQQNAMCATIMSSGCLEGNTLVTTNAGFLPIRSIVNGKLDVAVKTHEGWEPITAYFDNGEKDVVRVSFENGRDIVCTKEHRFHTISPLGEIEKKPIGDMGVGDTCLFPTQATPFAGSTIDDELSYVLGHYWANGYTGFRDEIVHNVNITFADTEIGEKARLRCEGILERNGLRFSTRRDASRGACTDIQMFGDRARYFVELAGEKGYSANIEFPEEVSIIPFIAGYFDGDGSWKSAKKGPHFTSISLPMLKSVQNHLANLGIPSKLYSEARSNGWATLYRVAISGPHWQTKFQDALRPWLLKIADIPTRKGHSFVFPPQSLVGAWAKFPAQYKYANRVRMFSTDQNVSYHTFLSAFPESDLLKFGGIRITDIEDAGRAHVYDLEVKDTHSYVANGISVSNSRRGAMMLTLRDDHPDLYHEDQDKTIFDATGNEVPRQPSFINAKRQRGRLTNFNVSVLVGDAFMKAVENDSMWDLGFHVPRADGQHSDVYPKPMPYDVIEIDNEGNETRLATKGQMFDWFVYRRVRAREIWDTIMRNTYTYAEPGVIFIDAMNSRNNLRYCEEIRTTNPCAEQGLPPHGCCCLGSINLAFLVRDPFTEHARVDEDAYARAIKVGVRFLDNVLDKSNYPLEAQRVESQQKRRIGLGITGFADMLLQLRVKYGSQESLNVAEKLARGLQHISYDTSINIASEKGPFLAYNAVEFCKSPNVPEWIKSDIERYTIRNGVINTIAPNGTISLFLGNVSGGVEPIFALRATRNVRQADNSTKQYESVDYAVRLFEALYPGQDIREQDYWVGAMGIAPLEHVRMQAVWQKYIDSSISKTVNCSYELSFDDFKEVYREAYNLGCKGCTTYRPDPISGRGSVLSETKTETPPASPKAQEVAVCVEPRPAILEARTYKIRWPTGGGYKGYQNLYITISRNEQNQPMEVFITTKDATKHEWVTALSRMITAVLRRGGPVKFLPYELMEVHAATGGAWVDKKYRASVVAAIGGVIETEFKTLGLIEDDSIPPAVHERREGEPIIEVDEQRLADPCPKCGAPTWVHESGCATCKSCGHSNCE